MSRLKIATFNINGIRARLPNLLEWLRRESPDIVCLQELKCTDAAFPIDEIRKAGYGAIWHGQVSWNGVAILAKGADPIESQRGLAGDKKDTQSRYLEAAAHGVVVACLYLPNGNPQPGSKFDYKLQWFDRLIKHAAGLLDRDDPVVLAGDFNVVPTDADIYNTRSWLKNALLQPEPRARYRQLLDQGWIDALKSKDRERRIYTFWDYFRRHWETDSGLRIDHLLLNGKLAPRLLDSGVDRWVRGEPHASDHAPTWIELDMGENKRTHKKQAQTSKATRGAASTKKGKTLAPTRPSPARVKESIDGEAFPPELCRPLEVTPTGDDWLHEIKWDGYRILATVHRGKIRLWSRNAIEWTDRLPELVSAIKQLKLKSAQLDGELIALDGEREDFNLLKARLSGSNDAALIYMLFDLIHRDGYSLAGQPLVERKKKLEELIEAHPHPVLRFSSHVIGGGASAFEQAISQGLEGIVSKKIDSSYRSGRGGDWVKTKGRISDEFLIIGYTAPKGSRTDLGALLLGQIDGKTIRYCGRCGTGFSAYQLRSFRKSLDALKIEEPAADVSVLEPRVRRHTQWVKPSIVVEIYHMGLGGQGLLRHPAFKAIRDDKRPKEATGAVKPSRTNPAQQKLTPPATPAAKARSRKSTTVQEDQPEVHISHPDRVMYADTGFTKGDIAAYYEQVMPWLLPQIVGRPLSILRCPDGVEKAQFFQKHAGKGWGEHINSILIRESKGTMDYIGVSDAAGVLELVQMNTVEFHPWGARNVDVERADRLVFDLDPGPGVQWTQVKNAASEFRSILQSIGLQSFLRCTGGKGLHVVVPLSPSSSWEQTKRFAAGVASAMAESRPKEFVDVAVKAKRTNRIFIDWLRNGRGATSVASYSLRARPGAKVAVPLAWSELKTLKSGDAFDAQATIRRLKKQGADPWAGIDQVRQTLDAAEQKLQGDASG